MTTTSSYSNLARFSLLSSFFITTVFCFFPPGFNTYLDNARKLRERNTLAFGASCSYADELKRISFQLKVLDSMKDERGIYKQVRLNGELESLLASSSYCDQTQSLSCGADNHCTCSASIPPGYTGKTEFIREDGKCVLARNSSCTSVDEGGAACQQGAECKFKGQEGGECGAIKIIREVNRILGGWQAPDVSVSDRLAKNQEIIFNGICICE